MRDFLRASAWLLGDGLFVLLALYEIWSLRRERAKKHKDERKPPEP